MSTGEERLGQSEDEGGSEEQLHLRLQFWRFVNWAGLKYLVDKNSLLASS